MSQNLSQTLLDWYDHNARTLPWRVSPEARKSGVAPDPYRVWLSEIMLQQTTVAAVIPYFNTFTQRWPNIQALARAPSDEVMARWAGLGYYARARNLLKCAEVVSASPAGTFPREEAALLKLPGIGPYTAAAIAAIAFDLPATVVDGNVERVMARLFQHTTPLPDAKPALKAHAASLTPQKRPGDYAQAVMDLGATICTPRNPACGICPLQTPCKARRAGTAETLPAKRPKAAKPVREGTAYIAMRASDGALLMERRPEKGLLGGMLGWPGADWSDACENTPPLKANWQPLNAQARHTFTHFHLILNLRIARVPANASPSRGFFVAPDAFSPDSLPTVMKKAYMLAREPLATLT